MHPASLINPLAIGVFAGAAAVARHVFHVEIIAKLPRICAALNGEAQ